MNSEASLLLYCATLGNNSNSTERIRTLIRNGIDWQHLLTLAERHRMHPLLYWNLNPLTGEVPADVFESLRRKFQKNAKQTLWIANQLTELIELFAANDIPTIALKGPVLAQSAYGNVALREAGDLDILVPSEKVEAACALLLTRGFERHMSWYASPEKKEMEGFRQLCLYAIALQHSRNGLAVEVHWAIAPRFFLPSNRPDWLWDGAWMPGDEPREIVLTPEKTLLVLAVHGARHLWERLSWLTDVAQFIRSNPDLNWQTVLDTANRLGYRRMLFLSLLLTHNLLKAPVPKWVLDKTLTDMTVVRLGDWLSERLFEDRPTDSQRFIERTFTIIGDISIQYVHYRLRICDSLMDQFRCSLSLLRLTAHPTPRDSVIPLPASLHFVYYAVRPLRLVLSYGRNLLRRRADR